MDALLAEAAQMTNGAIMFAMGTGQAGRIPDRLVPLRERVLKDHKAELAVLNAALDQRFKQPDAIWMGVFRAAALDAVTEYVGREQLQPSDRNLLRQLWNTLLSH